MLALQKIHARAGVALTQTTEPGTPAPGANGLRTGSMGTNYIKLINLIKIQ